MTTINPSTQPMLGSDGLYHGFRSIWAEMADGDDGTPVVNVDLADKSVHVFGDFGGGTLTIEGSNDGGTNWATLNDPQGVPLDLTSACIKAITEISQKIRPRATGTTSVTVAFVSRTNSPSISQ